MKSITEINDELKAIKKEYEDKKANLISIRDELQSKCNHQVFRVKHFDYDDNGCGVPRYDYSQTQVTCLLCDLNRLSKTYDKRISGLGEFRPEPENIFNGLE